MRKTGIAGVLAAVVLAGGWWLGTTRASQPAGAAKGLTLLITLGQSAKAAERWDGAVRVHGGTLVSLEGRHFSSGDAITGPGTWRCVPRRDQVAPYADIHYTEMRPGETPPVYFHPVGVYVTVEPVSARVAVETAQGKFEFAASEIGAEPRPFLNGRASVQQVPTVEKLSTEEYEDDEPALAALPGGGLAAAWVAYRERADRILLRTRSGGAWSAPEEVTPKPGDLWRCSLAATPEGLWVFWSERDGDRWHIRGRQKRGGAWEAPMRISGDGSNTFHRAAASAGGNVFVVWQSQRGAQSDVYLKVLAGGTWSEEMRVSESPANDWEPVVATGPDGSAFVAWDTYEAGNYDVRLRAWRGGKLGPVQAITSSPRFQAQASVAADAQGRPWVAWNESGVNWGKDQGFLIPTPLAAPLHQERWLRVAMWNGNEWQEPRPKIAEALPAVMRRNAERPQLAFDGKGGLTMMFRHWTRRNSRQIGSPMAWENYLTRFDGERWSAPQPVASSQGSVEKHAALARDASGELWAAWMTDSRPFSTMVPGNAEIFCARLGAAAASIGAGSFTGLAEPPGEAIPVHAREQDDVKAIRAHAATAGGRQYRIYRGDMHRHTDVSQDFKYDGSLIEVYRYARDAAAFDYVAATDHQTGFDQEFTWWQNQKLVDLFHAPGAFVPLFAYERSVPFPNGHRNIVFAHRGVRTFPIPEEERRGRDGAAKLFEHLRANRGISMPHSSATAQGTDWRDNDPEIEPLIEIYQGYRTSYEYEGAPRAASTLNKHAQKSGWQPEGFWWNALAKGYKLGVQASSDHWSTHISYACLLADSFTREGLLEAIRKRHAYAATDNIVLDFRARSGETTYLMGDSFAASSAPQLLVRAIGTGAIKQIDVIKNRTFVYTARPGAREAAFDYTDQDFGPGESWYYIRVLQEDGQLAWSSPIWVRRP